MGVFLLGSYGRAMCRHVHDPFNPTTHYLDLSFRFMALHARVVLLRANPNSSSPKGFNSLDPRTRTWTPKVCKIMALMAVFMGLGLLFYILLGFR